MSFLPTYYRYQAKRHGNREAIARLSFVQNAFASAKARRWFFANLGKEGGPKDRKAAAKKAKSAGSMSSDEYAKDLKDDLSKRKPASGSHEAEAVRYLATTQNPADLAMAKHVEAATDRDTMLEVMGAQASWFKSPEEAPMEWAGAVAVGAADNPPPGVAPVTLTDKQKTAYKARVEFTQAYIREQMGDSFLLERGVGGEYTKNLPESGGEVPTRGLSSWTTDSFAASQFINSPTGGIMGRTVHPEEVFSTAAVGVKPEKHYKDDAKEIVTFHKKKTMRIDYVNYSDTGDDFDEEDFTDDDFGM